MTIKKMTFNRNNLEFGRTIPQPSEELVKNTPALHNASLEDAIKYGGDLTRQALEAMCLTFSKKYIVVDTKTHMLMPGFSPAISGWHTDGVPRGTGLNPTVKDEPNIHAQEDMDEPIYHLMVTGEGCLTKFIKEKEIELDVPSKPDSALYSMLDMQVSNLVASGDLTEFEAPSCTPVKWDWWEIHTAQPAKMHEWRFLIRVTETDIQPPKKDLRDIIRTQQQVYLPQNFGW